MLEPHAARGTEGRFSVGVRTKAPSHTAKRACVGSGAAQDTSHPRAYAQAMDVGKRDGLDSMVMRQGIGTHCPDGLGSSSKAWTVVVTPGVQLVLQCGLVWPLPNRSPFCWGS